MVEAVMVADCDETIWRVVMPESDDSDIHSLLSHEVLPSLATV